MLHATCQSAQTPACFRGERTPRLRFFVFYSSSFFFSSFFFSSFPTSARLPRRCRSPSPRCRLSLEPLRLSIVSAASSSPPAGEAPPTHRRQPIRAQSGANDHRDQPKASGSVAVVRRRKSIQLHIRPAETSTCGEDTPPRGHILLRCGGKVYLRPPAAGHPDELKRDEDGENDESGPSAAVTIAFPPLVILWRRIREDQRT
ncbi:hypothetical protein EYF80_036950 [Liparis tanakae]|uniref:Uncharacterized protein n=1 Tax=Liparis tanakae TaxID=230148 RepID=A0A4Z2GHQ6_9TELE|nr:hypothetical protein EYF80_036950 [Liparis tanakae]